MTADELDKSESVGVAIRDASARVEAPRSLRANVAAAQLARQSPMRRWWWAPVAMAGVALAVVVMSVVTIAPGGSSSTTAADAAPLGLAKATHPAPKVAGRFIDERVGSIRFPNYDYGLSYKPTGIRYDTVDGRKALTVIYSAGASRVGYTVLDGKPLDQPASAKGVSFAEFDAAAFNHDGARVLTWRRDGHTCVLVSRTASLDTMLQMAAWA